VSHYKANLEDIEFALFEVLGLDKTLDNPAFAGLDRGTVKEILGEVKRLAEGPLSDSFAAGDLNPPVFDPNTFSVKIGEETKAAFDTLMQAEWWRMEIPERLGGTPMPPSVRWAVAECLLGANPPLFLYMGGPGFATILDQLGNDAQRNLASIMVERQWAATMVLTEPDAGSDVGAGRTTAVQQPDGSWHLSGVKRFITGAEHDLSENIVHFVLARPVGVEGAGGPGTKGLSLFIVPKFLFDLETGELVERNGVYVTGVEHKMGLKSSTTCDLVFGQHDKPAIGWLVGDVHNGIAQMFKVIEWARMMVGTKAIATLSTGYLNALDYAKNRVQGADIASAGDKTAPKVAIIEHPDVRRMLMLQKAYAEGLRALVLYTASWQDRGVMAQVAGDTEAEKKAHRMNDLLLPIVKGVGSERSYEMLALSLQTIGGSGYVQDYPFEQYLRDAKIDTLYEGTTGIQGMDFLFRKLFKDHFESWGSLGEEIRATIASAEGEGEDATKLEGMLQEVTEMSAKLAEWALSGEHTQLRYVGENTTRFLMASGDLLIAWLLLREALVAKKLLEQEETQEGKRIREDFLVGKIAASRYFLNTVAPRVTSELAVLKNTDSTLQEIPVDAF